MSGQRATFGTVLLVLSLLAGAVAGQLPAANAAPAPAAAGPAAPTVPAGATAATAATATATATDASTVDPRQRASVLPAGWSGSTDLAWTTTGDAHGFHLLVAEQSTGYTWRTAATLMEPGVDTDRWIGNACVTGSGRRAVVVYAPRQFTNRARLFDRGAFSAVVDLVTGQVTKLALGATLAYFNPGCGAGETAVLTQAGQDLGKTRLHWLDAATGTLSWHVELDGQVSSAVPVGDKIVAVDHPGLIQVGQAGKPSTFAATAGTAFDVHPVAAGGVVYLEQRGTDTAVARAARAGSVTDLASGPLAATQLSAGTGGRVFLTGKPAKVSALPAGVSTVDVPASAEVSTQGQLAVTYDAGRAGEPAVSGANPAGAEESGPVRLTATVVPTGKQVAFTVTPGMRPSQFYGEGRKPAAAAAAGPSGKVSPQVAGSPTDPVDADRTCAIPRNDVRTQVYQPHWNQVEWAADLAVANALTITRPANWKNAGMPAAWSPQGTGMFPPVPLAGGGSVPPQILLGVLTQESNLWQASSHVVEGDSGNPLVGSFYGQTFNGPDGWAINFADADCGYGVGQITDGMRSTDTSLSAVQKRGLTVDYATNIAASVRILAQKWNQTRAARITVNDGSPQWLENWYAAAWAYNTGMQPSAENGNTTGCTPGPSCTDGAGNWGLGYTNNPANISYPRNRPPFLELSQDDARHPQHWPYQEKVLGSAAYPIVKVELTDPGTWHAGFAQAWWLTNFDRSAARAPFNTFCTTADHCDINRSGEACSLANFHCWWNQAVTYKPNCNAQCGHSTTVYSPGTAEPGGREGMNYPPRCGTGGLPSNALVVDDQPNTVPPMRACGRPTNAGSFSLSFTADSSGRYRSKSDFHQIGAGYGDHFWFAHTRIASDNNGWLKVTGTWTLSQALNGWGRVLVHLPDHGAHTQQARYDVDLGNGTFSKFRVIPQGTEENKWVSLGVYRFAGTPKVRLSNETQDGYGAEDVAWDAVAVQPLPAKPRHIVAALGDSYSSGEGAGSYYRETDDNHGTARWTACRRSRNAWPRKMVLPGQPASTGSLADGWSTSVELGFVACSGARNWQVQGNGVPRSWADLSHYEWGEGEFREIGQIDSGVLDENTTLVTLSIGGNDAGFASVLRECGNLPDCSNDPDFLPKYKGRIDTTQPDTRTTIRDIKAKAFNAQIVLVGYPELLSRTVKCGGSWYYDGTEADALAVLANYMAQQENASVTTLKAEGIKVEFADAIQAFVGHGGCDDPEWINKIVIGPNGDGDYHNGDNSSEFCLWQILGGACLSRETFHPKNAGTTGYAQMMQNKLQGIGYVGS